MIAVRSFTFISGILFLVTACLVSHLQLLKIMVDCALLTTLINLCSSAGRSRSSKEKPVHGISEVDNKISKLYFQSETDKCESRSQPFAMDWLLYLVSLNHAWTELLELGIL